MHKEPLAKAKKHSFSDDNEDDDLLLKTPVTTRRNDVADDLEDNVSLKKAKARDTKEESRKQDSDPGKGGNDSYSEDALFTKTGGRKRDDGKDATFKVPVAGKRNDGSDVEDVLSMRAKTDDSSGNDEDVSLKKSANTKQNRASDDGNAQSIYAIGGKKDGQSDAKYETDVSSSIKISKEKDGNADHKDALLPKPVRKRKSVDDDDGGIIPSKKPVSEAKGDADDDKYLLLKANDSRGDNEDKKFTTLRRKIGTKEDGNEDDDDAVPSKKIVSEKKDDADDDKDALLKKQGSKTKKGAGNDQDEKAVFMKQDGRADEKYVDAPSKKTWSKKKNENTGNEDELRKSSERRGMDDGADDSDKYIELKKPATKKESATDEDEDALAKKPASKKKENTGKEDEQWKSSERREMDDGADDSDKYVKLKKPATKKESATDEDEDALEKKPASTKKEITGKEDEQWKSSERREMDDGADDSDKYVKLKKPATEKKSATDEDEDAPEKKPANTKKADTPEAMSQAEVSRNKDLSRADDSEFSEKPVNKKRESIENDDDDKSKNNSGRKKDDDSMDGYGSKSGNEELGKQKPKHTKIKDQNTPSSEESSYTGHDDGRGLDDQMTLQKNEKLITLSENKGHYRDNVDNDKAFLTEKKVQKAENEAKIAREEDGEHQDDDRKLDKQVGLQNTYRSHDTPERSFEDKQKSHGPLKVSLLDQPYILSGKVKATLQPDPERNALQKGTLAESKTSHNSSDGNESAGPSLLDWLAPHNAERLEVGVPPLVWSEEVAQFAESWADKRRKNGCTMLQSDGPYGENMFWGSSAGYGASECVAAWAEEKSRYQYADGSCSGGSCGHYTQMVWAKSVRLGCARTECLDGTVFMICNYDPPGNFVGAKPF
ncbi:hypothetical protein KP509_14G098400 [Ceratopteris richardii]|uniref:SCP domain-containing protein n=1 Tax=Ceratopteris richardii TaxID=49495 RepID=A0A8T2TAP8_CERRI|nr:hypothetical protein KP509_14G098400 [Ceratopteris richardii]